MARVDFQGPTSAAERNLLAQLEGPYVGTVPRVVVPVSGAGAAAVDWATRHLLVLAVIRRDLGEETVRVTVTLDPGGAGQQVLPAATFAPWTQRDAGVPVYAPDTRADAGVPPFTLEVAVELAAEGAGFAAVTGAALTDLVELAVLEGNLGRLLFLAVQEKTRLRQAARQVQAYRTLAHARRDALDRIGADVGVTRFDDELVHDSGTGGVYARRLPPPQVEADAAYARRLGPYRRFLLPTPGAVDLLLNGPGAPSHPNTGLFADAAGGARLRLVEADDQFAVALQLIAVGDPQHLPNFLAQLRRDRLVLPADTPANTAVHHARRLSATQVAAVDALRASLRQSFAWTDTHGIVPPLAHALDRAGRVCRAAGATTSWTVSRAQDDTGGSRYQLGLGADLKPPTEQQATNLRTKLLDDNRTPSGDTTAEALIAAVRAAGVPDQSEDPDLGWLWRLAGLQTVHRVDTTTLYVSHLPTQGLVLTAPATIPVDDAQPVEAHFHAPGDPGTNALLLQGLTDAAAAWGAAGESPWTGLDDTQARARWATVPARPADQPVQQAIGAAGLPLVTDPAQVVAALNQLPDELLETVELDAGFSAALVAGEQQAADRLARLVAVLRASHLAAVLPLVDSSDKVLLVVSVIGLPQAGFNLSERLATAFRWYLVGLGGATGEVRTVGSHSAVRGFGPGLVAVVVLSYVRTGLTDPYEFRVDLPEGVALSLLQYERLINTFLRVCPIGVEVNTFAIRRQHVDLDGDGVAEPLLPAVARTFRTYQRRKLRGVYD
jgi:hypothetical protein